MKVESYLKKGFTALFFISVVCLFSGCNWFKTYYTVSYQSEYGKVPDPIELLAGSTLTVGQARALSEKGHIFKGWYDGDTKAEAGKYVISKDVTLVAAWEDGSYKIDYNNIQNLSSEENNKLIKEYKAETETFELYRPEARGYIFKGWYPDSEFKKEEVTIIEQGSTKDYNLYAKWELIDYKIEYRFIPEDTENIYGYQNNPRNKDSYNVENYYSCYFNEPVATKSDKFMFLGWFKGDSPSSERINGIDWDTTGDLVVYGIFGVKRTITYMYSSGITYTANEVADGYILTESDLYCYEETADSDMIFYGFYTEDSVKVEAGTVVTSDLVLYPRHGKKLSITYITENKEKGIEREVDDFAIAAGSNLTEDCLPTLFSTSNKNDEKKVYKIEGWYTEPEYKNKLLSNCYQINNNLVLYAKWVEVDKKDEPAVPDGFVLVEGAAIKNFNYFYDRFSGSFFYTNPQIKDYYISPYEVTQELYTNVMEKNPSCFIGNEEAGELQKKRPVDSVSWYDAIYFCNELSRKQGLEPCYTVDGKSDVKTWKYTPHNYEQIMGFIECDFTANGYRLPTDVEWEYAARGGHITYKDFKAYKEKNVYNYGEELDYSFCFSFPFSLPEVEYLNFSNTLFEKEFVAEELDKIAWYWYNMAESGKSINSDINNYTPDKTQKGYGTHEVGKKKPNALGLYDIAGNVWEWTYSENLVIDYCSKLSSYYYYDDDGSITIVSFMEACRRGGSWDSTAIKCSIANFSSVNACGRMKGNGFRLVRTAK